MTGTLRCRRFLRICGRRCGNDPPSRSRVRTAITLILVADLLAFVGIVYVRHGDGHARRPGGRLYHGEAVTPLFLLLVWLFPVDVEPDVETDPCVAWECNGDATGKWLACVCVEHERSIEL